MQAGQGRPADAGRSPARRLTNPTALGKERTMRIKLHLFSAVRLGTALVAVAIVAGLVGLALARAPSRASADENRNTDVTFTKWVTDTDWPAFPWDMKGVVGGDAGQGTFTGEVLTRVDNGTTTTIHALYH